MDVTSVTGAPAPTPTPPTPPAPVQGFADVLAGVQGRPGHGSGGALGADTHAMHATAADAATSARVTLGRMLGQVGHVGPGAPAVPAAAQARAPGEGLPDRVRALGPLVVPVEGRRTSDFGPRTHPITGEQHHHTGVDVAAVTGTPVASAAAGTVVHAGPAGGYGLLVEVAHGDGVVSRYAHLSATDVEVGQRLDAGARVGAVGSTGRSTGPHLHLELRVDGTAVDPRGLLAA